jgi:putative hemolysin
MATMFQIEELLEAKYPTLASRPDIITRPMIAFLKKLLREDEVNAFLAQSRGLEGNEFIDRILEHFNFSYTAVGREIENIPAEGRVVIVANHPLGLLDGVALMKLVREVRPDVRMVANDVLMQFHPPEGLILPVVNIGKGFNKENVQAIHAALENDEAIIVFPSGEVSRAGPRGIRDGRWHAGFLSFAERAHAPILPVLLDGRNSALFYGVSTFLKTISAFMLVDEAYRQRASTLPIRIGELIPWRALEALALPRREKIRHIASQVYGIGTKRVVRLRTEKAVAHPEDRLALRRELHQAEVLGETADGKRILLFDGRASSTVMREVGRLRELSFRQVGEGTGKRRDIDAFDAWYRHVLLWDDDELQIVGAYRVGDVREILASHGRKGLYTEGLFSYSGAMLDYLPRSLELGRSFVQPRYRGKRSLEYLWYGIGAYLRQRKDVRYLFGPVSISAELPQAAREMLVHFYRRHFGAPQGLALARAPYVIGDDMRAKCEALFPGDDHERDFRALKRLLGEMDCAVPTLYKQYTDLCEPGGACFLEFGVDAGFNGCIDGLVLVDLEKMRPAKRERYLEGGGRLAQAVGETLLKSA